MNVEFHKFFERYGKTYDEFDVPGMMQFVHCPMITVREGAASIHATSDQVAEFFAKLLEWFRSIDHGRGSITSLEVRMLGPKSAFANVVWRSTRSDRSKFTEWPTAYHLVQIASGWKILAIILRYEPARETPC